jgi:hypothetical protein
MKNITRYKQLVNEILPPRQFIVVGGGALAAYGIRDCEDLDVILSPTFNLNILDKLLHDKNFPPLKTGEEFEEATGEMKITDQAAANPYGFEWNPRTLLYFKPPHDCYGGLKVEFFREHRIPASTMCTATIEKSWGELWSAAEEIDGILFQGIDDLLLMKMCMTREKDMRDVQLINNYKLRRY